MIKTKNGKVKIKGRVNEIMADIAVIVRSAKKGFIEKAGMTNATAEEAVKFAVELGLSDEKIGDTIEKMTGDPDGE